MKKSGLFIALIIFCINIGFSHVSMGLEEEMKEIQLSPFESNSIFIYENYNSIIFLDKMKVIEKINKHLENVNLCEFRRLNYNNILQRMKNSDSSFYAIQPTISPDILAKMRISPDLNTNTGDKWLDYYAKKIKMDISRDYIPPFGYKIEIDTIGKSCLEKYYSWMISELVLDGDAKIYNKFGKKYESTIYFEIVSFAGHGGETLLFSDKKPFFSVKSYSDVRMPDRECGDNYKGYEIIE
jgi:hypothetical protein